MHPSLEYIIQNFACDEARYYVWKATESGLTDQEIWEDCMKPEWMAWLILRCLTYLPDKERLSVLSSLKASIAKSAYKRAGLEIHSMQLHDAINISLEYLTRNLPIKPQDVCDVIREQYPQISTLVEIYDNSYAAYLGYKEKRQ